MKTPDQVRADVQAMFDRVDQEFDKMIGATCSLTAQLNDEHHRRVTGQLRTRATDAGERARAAA